MESERLLIEKPRQAAAGLKLARWELSQYPAVAASPVSSPQSAQLQPGPRRCPATAKLPSLTIGGLQRCVGEVQWLMRPASACLCVAARVEQWTCAPVCLGEKGASVAVVEALRGEALPSVARNQRVLCARGSSAACRGPAEACKEPFSHWLISSPSTGTRCWTSTTLRLAVNGSFSDFPRG